METSVYDGRKVNKQVRVLEATNGSDKSLGMSLTSTLSSSLDLGDLSSVWNRKTMTTNMDNGVHKDIINKYKMDRWLRFEDVELEEEFVEKYFHGSINTHRAFCKIVPCIFGAFIVLTFLTYVIVSVLMLHILLGGGPLLVLYLSKKPWFHTYQFYFMAGTVIYDVIGLGLQRQFLDFDKLEPWVLSNNDSRGYFIVLLFAQYATFMSLRFTLKNAFIVAGIIDVIYYIHIAIFGNIWGFDYLESTVAFIIVSIALGSATYLTEYQHRNQEIGRAAILRHTEEVAKEKVITEKLLLNILPTKIARRLMDGEEVIADGYDHVTVLFADLVNWTEISRSMQPTEAIELLNEIVSNFDRLTHIYKIEKIKTIGDAYLIACGLPEPMPAKESCRRVANFALDMLRVLEGLSKAKGKTLGLTLGIHNGPVVAGVIGKTKFLYDLWGDSVNTASRMQSHGDPNLIHVTSEVFELLSDEFNFEKRPKMQVKGKGEMQTYYLLSQKEGLASQPTPDAISGPHMQPPAAPEAQGATNAEEEGGKEEDLKKGSSREERKKRKIKEARHKRNAEIDQQLDSKITSKRGVLRFIDPHLENGFQRLQKKVASERMPKFTIFLILVEFIAGLDIFKFDRDEVWVYYMIMGGCIGIQVVLLATARLAPSEGSVLNKISVSCLHFALLVLLAYYKLGESYSIRFIYFFTVILSIVTFMASTIPYRQARVIVWVHFFLFLVIIFIINSQDGVDLTGMLMYICLTIFGHETAKHVEKHWRREYLLSNLTEEERKRVVKQREESERLLYNILPESVIRKMRDSDGKIIDTYDTASVMFADIVGFTVLSSKLDARSIVTMLNSMFSQVDTIAEQKGMEKIKTIGDAYMVVAGLPYPRPDHAKIAVEMALEMVRVVQALPEIEGLRVNVRIGVHSGRVVGGIIGASKMVFDIWGENVNIASKMESNGTPGCVNVSHITKDLVGDDAGIEFEKRDKVVKYNGREMMLYYARFKDTSNPNASKVDQKDW
eukprot:TRINITY_DN124_c0_g1_i13.p1 TRINITY_DN124_c0_g1~~TRINITY_DN124_c0_g1_i13.p1  ORF type:complete len:1006 (-),score=235.88 TRINITY_DN124_c0_g1_i13:351-3368(-)